MIDRCQSPPVVFCYFFTSQVAAQTSFEAHIIQQSWLTEAEISLRIDEVVVGDTGYVKTHFFLAIFCTVCMFNQTVATGAMAASFLCMRGAKRVSIQSSPYELVDGNTIFEAPEVRTIGTQKRAEFSGVLIL